MSFRSQKNNPFPMASEKIQTYQNGNESGIFTRFGLRSTIMFWFLAISIIPVVFVSLMGYHNAVQNRVEDFSKRLESISETERRDFQQYFETLNINLQNMAGNPQVLAMLEFEDSALETSFPVSSGGRLLKAFQLENNARDILLADGRGNIVFSSQTGCTPGADLGASEIIEKGLRRISSGALAADAIISSGFKPRPHRGGTSLAYQMEPVRSDKGEVLGFLIMELGVDIFANRFGRQNFLNPGILTYVLNEDLQILASFRNLAGSSATSSAVSIAEAQAWRHHLKRAEDQNSWEIEFHQVREYSGLESEQVLGIIQDLDILGEKYALVSEMPRSVVLAGLKGMGLSLLLVIALVSLLVVLAGLLVSNRIVDPINQLGRVMQRVADGHEVWTLPENGPREVFQLSQMFHCMISRLTDAQEVNEKQYALKRRQFELNEKLRGENSLEDISEAVLNYLGEFFEAHMGIFYLVEARETYRMVAQFGLPENDAIIDEIHLGEGLMGRVASGRRVRVLRRFREDRHKVETGLVSSYVNNLVVAPIQLGNRVLGLLELGLMDDVGDEKIEFLDMVSETIAVAINSARSRERVHRLLKETWSQAAILSKQQKDLQESNRRFELADQYKSEFLANMSHELRTPLNSLLIMSQVLAENRDQNLSRQEVDSAWTINRAGSDLLLLINDILDLSKVDAGKLNIQFSSFNLKSLLMEMEDLFKPVAQKQNLEFHTFLGPELPEVMVSDPLRLTQVLKNILNNAFKFTPEGSVTLRVRIPSPGEQADCPLPSDAPMVVFSVSDTGVGISDKVKNHIFEAFNQGDGSIGRRYGGSGLGLSISKKLSEMLGGYIDVKSIEGKGTTFSLYLALQPADELAVEPVFNSPATKNKSQGIVGNHRELPAETSFSENPPQEKQSEELIPDSPDLSNRKVLIGEDDMRTVFQISEVLDDLGAIVTLAPSWSQAVAEGLNEGDFDFAIISNRLADRPGSASILAWKKECGMPEYPVLTLVQNEEGPQCPGADLVGSRPLVREQFIGLINKALAMEPVPR